MTPPGDSSALVEATLDGLGLPYDRIEIDPEFADTEDFCRQYGYRAENSANTLVVASKKAPRVFAACIIRASVRLDVNKKVRKLLGGAKLSFAASQETRRITGMLVGGITPFGLPRGWPVLVDQGLMERPYVILGGGNRSWKVKISPAVFRRLPGARIADIAMAGEARQDLEQKKG
ncbi:MAG: YbaK/EbsC family protein [Acidobacteriota bacterium]